MCATIKPCPHSSKRGAATHIINMHDNMLCFRRHPNGLILARSICDTIFCLSIVSSHLYHKQQNFPPDAASHCDFFSVWAQYCGLAAELYVLFLSLDLVISVQNPFSDYRANSFKYHAGAQLAAAASVALLMTARTGKARRHAYGQDNFLAVCWIRQFDEGVEGGVSPWWWGLFNVPVACVYAFMLFTLARVSRRLRQGLPASLSVRRSSLSAGRLYLTAYALYWTISGVFYLVCFSMNKDDPPLQFLIVFAAMFGLRGVVTLLVWVRSDEYRLLTKAWDASGTLDAFRHKKRFIAQQQGYGSDAGSALTPRQWALDDESSVVSDASALPGGTALNDFASIMQPKQVQGGEHMYPAMGGATTSLTLGSMHLHPTPAQQPPPPHQPLTGPPLPPPPP